MLQSFQVKSMTLKLTDPKITAEDMNVKSLAVLCGQNGVGKSLVMKFIWALSFMAHNRVLMPEQALEHFDELCQFTLDNTFIQQTFTGDIGCTFEGQFSINIKLMMGKVVDIVLVGFEEDIVQGFPRPKYMSSNLRLFDAMSHYLALRKAFVGVAKTVDEATLAKLLENYRLYDIMYMEGLIAACPITVKPETSDILQKNYDFPDPIDTFDVDLDRCDFGISGPNHFFKTTKTLGAGHQAVLNMTIGSIS